MRANQVVRCLLVALGCVVSMTAQAQFMREDGVQSFAGVLYNEVGQPRSVEWKFYSSGDEIMFASLDADVYRKFSEHGEATATAATAAADTGGGCSGDDGGGGPGLFRLKVLDRFEQVICSASRPAPPPGWMRDPRFACHIPKSTAPTEYRIRVELANPTGEMVQASYPFLLNISMRKIVQSGTSLFGVAPASTDRRGW